MLVALCLVATAVAGYRAYTGLRLAGLLRELHSGDEFAERDAVMGLAQLGRPAMDVVVAAIRSGYQRVEPLAAEALGRMGRASTARITQELEAPQRGDGWFWDALAHNGRSAVPYLTSQLQSRDSGDRMMAAYSLSMIGSAAQDAREVLVAVATTDTDRAARREAARALYRLGDEGKRELDRASRMARDPAAAEDLRDAPDPSWLLGKAQCLQGTLPPPDPPYVVEVRRKAARDARALVVSAAASVVLLLLAAALSIPTRRTQARAPREPR